MTFALACMIFACLGAAGSVAEAPAGGGVASAARPPVTGDRDPTRASAKPDAFDNRLYLPSTLQSGMLTSPRGLDLTVTRIVDGAGFDLAWVGDVVYRTEPGALVALDVADPALPREIGRSDLLPAMLRAVDVQGGLAVVAVGAPTRRTG
jgi:hypothetical protein